MSDQSIGASVAVALRQMDFLPPAADMSILGLIAFYTHETLSNNQTKKVVSFNSSVSSSSANTPETWFQ